MVPGISEKTGSTTSFVHSDHLGSMKALSSSGTVTDTASYDAFGNVVSRTGTNATQKGFDSGFGYQEDGESGHKLLGYRYYESETGRFLSRDPALDGRNWYSTCKNNPGKYFDSTGEMAVAATAVATPCGFIAGLTIAGVGMVALLVKGLIEVSDSIVDIIDEIGRKHAQRSQPQGPSSVPLGPTVDPGEPLGWLRIFRVGGPNGLYWSLEDPRKNPNFMVDYGLHTPNMSDTITVSQGEVRVQDMGNYMFHSRHYDKSWCDNDKFELFFGTEANLIHSTRFREAIDQVPKNKWKPNDETPFGAKSTGLFLP